MLLESHLGPILLEKLSDTWSACVNQSAVSCYKAQTSFGVVKLVPLCHMSKSIKESSWWEASVPTCRLCLSSLISRISFCSCKRCLSASRSSIFCLKNGHARVQTHTHTTMSNDVGPRGKAADLVWVCSVWASYLSMPSSSLVTDETLSAAEACCFFRVASSSSTWDRGDEMELGH